MSAELFLRLRTLVILGHNLNKFFITSLRLNLKPLDWTTLYRWIISKGVLRILFLRKAKKSIYPTKVWFGPLWWLIVLLICWETSTIFISAWCFFDTVRSFGNKWMLKLGFLIVIYIYIFWWILDLHWSPRWARVRVYIRNCAIFFWSCALIYLCFTLWLGTNLTLLYLIPGLYTIPWSLKMAVCWYIIAILYDFWNSLLELPVGWYCCHRTESLNCKRLLTIIFDRSIWRLWFDLRLI